MAFIVDGVLEKKVVQGLCGSAPVRVTNMNGRSVAIHALARAISALIKVFSNKHYPIVIVIDREQRLQSAADIEEEISLLLAQDGHDLSGLIIACADRMIENWICAGSSSYNNHQICQDRDNFDECHGKLTLKSELRNIGIVYRETTIGAEMFVRMQHKLAAERSISYERFVSKMIGFCPKLKAAF